jgi:hypothetical protein
MTRESLLSSFQPVELNLHPLKSLPIPEPIVLKPDRTAIGTLTPPVAGPIAPTLDPFAFVMFEPAIPPPSTIIEPPCIAPPLVSPSTSPPLPATNSASLKSRQIGSRVSLVAFAIPKAAC